MPVSLFWHRRDLRLEDNAGLFAALNSGFDVVPVFIFDTEILDKLSDEHDARVNFIHQELVRLKKAYQSVGSDLRVKHGQPAQVWPSLLEEFDVKEVWVNRDYEPYAGKRDQAVFDLLQSHGVQLKGKKDHVIFEKSEVVKDDGKPYTIYTPYSKKWKAALLHHPPAPFPSETHLDKLQDLSPSPMPSLESMGFKPTTQSFPEPFVPDDILRSYADHRDIPSLRGTSRLSIHLRFGTVSIRGLVRQAEATSEKWLNELIWRDFYQMILHHFPESVDGEFKPQYKHIPWRNNEEEFMAWCEGRTGYPLVDAGMRELNETGFMHNRVRMVVASFLTKHLLIDWRWGERYFAEKLQDFELASNVGGWQWAAGCGCDAAPYFRVFSPSAQFQKFDPKAVYVRKWVPEFEDFTRYPQPIVDHKMARQRAIDTYKKALEIARA